MTDRRPKNLLLAALPAKDWERMRTRFEEAELIAGDILFDMEEPFRRLYFPVSGVISHVAAFESGSMAETATTGREGMAGVAAVLGSDMPFGRQIVQMRGSALAVGYDDFKRLMDGVPAFRTALLAYAQTFLAQVLQSVACNAVHSVEQRTARWLLMYHDRSDGDAFPLTQEFLGHMLGASRPAVGAAARSLQQAGLIHYIRGVVTVKDRPGLEGASCECYKTVRRHYDERLRPILKANGHRAEGSKAEHRSRYVNFLADDPST